MGQGSVVSGAMSSVWCRSPRPLYVAWRAEFLCATCIWPDVVPVHISPLLRLSFVACTLCTLYEYLFCALLAARVYHPFTPSF